MTPAEWILIVVYFACGVSWSVMAGLFYIGYSGGRHLALKQQQPKPVQPKVSVVVAARNEADRIGSLMKCLAGQRYPREKYEVQQWAGSSYPPHRPYTEYEVWAWGLIFPVPPSE